MKHFDTPIRVFFGHILTAVKLHGSKRGGRPCLPSGVFPMNFRVLPQLKFLQRRHIAGALWLGATLCMSEAPLAVRAGEAPLVAIDVGHTLAAPGATSARGRSEFEFNRDLAQAVAAALTRLKLRTVIVNADGKVGSLAERPAQVPHADLLISIHHDSVGEEELSDWVWEGRPQRYSDRWQGHSLFVSRRNPDAERSLLCASAIGARLQRAGFAPTEKNARRREYADRQDAVHYYDDLVVLYRAQQPAVLIEAGVIRHREEELALRDPQRQAAMASEISTGVAACLMAGR